MSFFRHTVMAAVIGLLSLAPVAAAPGSLTKPDPQVVVLQTARGNIVFELYPNAAPKTVAQIKSLVKRHYYDGILFHRVIPDFMIQFGDPNTRKADRSAWGQGGDDVPKLKAEFNSLKHVPGIVSMARTSDPDSASSQFFICVGKASEFLDDKYTIFGHVIKGQKVAETIAHVKRNETDQPDKDEKVIKAFLAKHP